MICPGCNTLNFRDYKFCRECGQKLEALASGQLTQAMGSPTAVPEDAQIQRLLDEAFQAFDTGRLDDAALACQGALALRPESTAAHSMLGLIYERQGSVPDAIQQYRIVLELNPSSRADRAKLDALLSRTDQRGRPWRERLRQIRQVRPAVLAGTGAGALVVVTGILVLARASEHTERARRQLSPPPVRTAMMPAPQVAMPPPPVTPAPAPVPAPTPTVGAFPRRTLSNGPVPHVTQATVAPSFTPRVRPAPRIHPSFLSPAPIRGLGGLPVDPRSSLALRPASGPPPILPSNDSGNSAPPVMPASGPAQPPQYLPPTPPAAAAPVDSGAPGASISIRRLDDGSPSAPAAPVPPAQSGTRPALPTLGEARQHYEVASELQRQGDLAGAYREFEYARELFRIVNNRGGAEGALAAEGVRASQRALLELARARQ